MTEFLGKSIFDKPPLCKTHMTEEVGYEGKFATVINYRIGKPNKEYLIIPGLPGGSVSNLNEFLLQSRTQRIYFCDSSLNVLIHSGIKAKGNPQLTLGNPYLPNVIGGINRAYGKDEQIKVIGVTPNDWVEEIKTFLLNKETSSRPKPTKIIGHSFGGIFSMVALGELINTGQIKIQTPEGKPRFSLTLISAPTYYPESLPDRRALINSSPDNEFTYYNDHQNQEVMGPNDSRIPMASNYAFDNIWDFLNSSNTIKVNPDKQEFNFSLKKLLFNRLNEAGQVLSKSEVRVLSFTPYLDRWISEIALGDLTIMLNGNLIAESLNLPSTFSRNATEINAHDLLPDILQEALKYNL